jgi:hypothetical protein
VHCLDDLLSCYRFSICCSRSFPRFYFLFDETRYADTPIGRANAPPRDFVAHSRPATGHYTMLGYWKVREGLRGDHTLREMRTGMATATCSTILLVNRAQRRPATRLTILSCCRISKSLKIGSAKIYNMKLSHPYGVHRYEQCTPPSQEEGQTQAWLSRSVPSTRETW